MRGRGLHQMPNRRSHDDATAESVLEANEATTRLFNK